MLVKRSVCGYVAELSPGDPVDVLFDSVAALLRNNAIGVILTGMGKEGAQGLLKMRQSGAWTMGQNQQSCVVFGMPREAAQVGAIDEVLALSDASERIMSRLRAFDCQGKWD